MKYKFTPILLSLSLITNFYLVYLLVYNTSLSQKVEAEEVLEVVDKNFFPQHIKLKNYSSVNFKIEDAGKTILKNAREFHKIPSLIDTSYRDKEVCSGYLWALSEEIWGKHIPYHIGMMDRESRGPSKAWELPDSYRFLGGEILVDFSNQIDLSKYKDGYLEMVSSEDLLKFFNFSFKEESLLGDIGFLYKNTVHIKGLLIEGVYNSHITKNIGISRFMKQLDSSEHLEDHQSVLQYIFQTNNEYLIKYSEIISKYKFYNNGKEMFLSNGNFYYSKEGKYIGEKVVFKLLDNLSYLDISLVHFFENTGRVDSLLDFSLSGKFFPMNVTTINGRLIEKM